MNGYPLEYWIYAIGGAVVLAGIISAMTSEPEQREPSERQRKEPPLDATEYEGPVVVIGRGRKE